MRLETFISPARTLILENVGDRDALLLALAEAGATTAGEIDSQTLYESLREREESGPTCTPEGVGFPHAMLESDIETVVIAAKLVPPVSMGSAEQPPVDLVFCMLGGKDKPWEHVRLLARLARIARAEGALQRLRGAGDASELYERLIGEDASHG
ncbi:MAG: PTS sugar transporter subunit IIA [Planctomycetota bacterium]|jgi:PTS system nitrogen regulatory IIA component